MSEETGQIMNHIDKIFTEAPFYGSRKILEALSRKGYNIGRERVLFAYEENGIECNLSKSKLKQATSRT